MKKVQPGDRMNIPAETFNTFIDAARAMKARQQDRGQGARDAFPQATIVLCKNNSGTDRARFDVLGVDAPIIALADNAAEFKRRPTTAGSTPSVADHYGRFVILQEPVAEGKIGRACVSGITIAKVHVAAEWHIRADVRQDDATCLQSDTHGSAMILWKESGTGLKWAVVKIGLPCRAQADEGFWAELGSASDLGNDRWSYAFTEVEHTGAGYDGWATKTGGRSGTAYNTIEDMNDGAGVEGNGVDLGTLDTPTYLPAASGAIVWMHELKHDTGSTPRIEYWFQYENEVTWSSGGTTYAGVHQTDRYLFDTLSVLSLDWATRYLCDGSGNTAVDWDERYLQDSSSYTAVDWGSRALKDGSGVTAVDWHYRRWQDDYGVIVGNWSNQMLYDGTPKQSIDWGNRDLYDSNEVCVGSWQSLELYDGGPYLSIDWGHRQLIGSDGYAAIIDWGSLGSTYGTPTINGTYTGGLYDSNNNLIADVENGLICNVYYPS